MISICGWKHLPLRSLQNSNNVDWWRSFNSTKTQLCCITTTPCGTAAVAALFGNIFVLLDLMIALRLIVFKILLSCQDLHFHFLLLQKRRHFEFTRKALFAEISHVDCFFALSAQKISEQRATTINVFLQ